MTSQKVSAWLLTDSAKKFWFYATGTVSSGLLLANYLPHTFFLDKYKSIVHLYKKGLSVPLPKQLQDRFEKVLDLLEVDPNDRYLYKPFHCYGFDVMSAGSCYSKYGVIVGLPVNFTYETINMVDKSKIKVNHESVVWDTEEGQKLLNSFILSENAQLYGMAREIKYRQTPKPIFDTIIGSLSCISVYSLSHYINHKFNLYIKPRPVRVGIYGFVSIFAFGMYAMLKDMSQIYYERSIDEELKKKNPIFAEGGNEYYGKILDRNQALRKLLGKEGESLFSVLGNENTFLRTRHIPIVQRKIFFEESIDSPT